MAYYVTVRDAGRTCFAAGPFNRHGDAERMVGPVKELVGEIGFREAAWAGYGTSHVKFGPLPTGRFNDRLGLPTAGRIAELDETVKQGRWIPGDVTDPVGYLRRHGTALEAKRMDRRLAA